MHDKRFTEEIRTTLIKKTVNLKEGSKVVAVNVKLSPFSHVKNDSLQEAFNITMKGSGFEDVTLNVKNIEVNVECKSCKAVFLINEPVFSCEECGSEDIDIKEIPEFFIESIEIEE